MSKLNKGLFSSNTDLWATPIEFFKELDACCKAHNGLWNPEAEKLIFEHFGVTVGL